MLHHLALYSSFIIYTNFLDNWAKPWSYIQEKTKNVPLLFSLCEIMRGKFLMMRESPTRKRLCTVIKKGKGIEKNCCCFSCIKELLG